MRQFASFFVCLGLLVAAALAATPTSVPVAFGSGACGAPIVVTVGQESSDDTNRQQVIERCQEASADRLQLAAVVLVLGLVAGFVTWIGARRREAAARAERYRRRQAAALAAANAAILPVPPESTAEEPENGSPDEPAEPRFTARPARRRPRRATTSSR